jgi:glutamyl-tRNA reductase
MTMTSSRQGVSPPSPSGLDALRVISWSHRNAGFVELARVALPGAAQQALVERLREAGLEATLLCTCNRTELYWYALGPADDDTARAALDAVVEDRASIEARVELEGVEAARHLFRLGAGLESLLVGETEVLGQLRDAILVAEEDGIARTHLPAFFYAALRFGRRVRAETRIGHGALSIASAAVRHLAQDFADLHTCTVVVIGAGVTGLKVARHLRARGLGRLVLLNRTRARAEAAVSSCEIPGSLDELPEWLAEADAVVAAVHVDEPLVTPGLLLSALAAAPTRERRTPLALVDLSLPRAIHPDCVSVPDVVLHDLSGLEGVVAENRSMREAEIPRVEELLERELEIFAGQARSTAVRPLVAALRRSAEAIRRLELDMLLAEKERTHLMVDRMTRRIVLGIHLGPEGILPAEDIEADPLWGSYRRSLSGLDLSVTLRQRAGAIREEELRRLYANGDPTPEALEHGTRRLVDRILQGAIEALRGGELEPRKAAYLRALLGLAEPETAEAHDKS